MDEQLKTTMKVQRAARSLTQADLAELAGITRKSINAILALKLAQALQVRVDELFSLDTAD